MKQLIYRSQLEMGIMTGDIPPTILLITDLYLERIEEELKHQEKIMKLLFSGKKIKFKWEEDEKTPDCSSGNPT